MALLRKSLVTCSVEREEASGLDIGYPTDVHHVCHVTFDRFNGFLGLPVELQPEVPRKVPSARLVICPICLVFSFVGLEIHMGLIPIDELR